MSQIYRPLFNKLKDLDIEVSVSQFAQAEGLRYANQAHRRHKWHRSACVSWTFNEPWPNAAHGSIVEYYGKPKMAYYYARNSYADVDVSAEYGALFIRSGQQAGFKLFVTSERQKPLNQLVILAKVLDLDGGILHREEWTVDVTQEKNTAVGDLSFVPANTLEGKVILIVVELHSSDGEKLSGHTYTFGIIGPDEDQPIPKGYMNNLLTATTTNLQTSASPETAQEWYGKPSKIYKLTVRNAGKAPALFVKIDTDDQEKKAIYINDNYFTLLADETRDVLLFVPEDQKIREFTPFQILIKAWNTKSISIKINN